MSKFHRKAVFGAAVATALMAMEPVGAHLFCPGEHTDMVSDLDSFLRQLENESKGIEVASAAPARVNTATGEQSVRAWSDKLGPQVGLTGAWTLAGGRAAEAGHRALGVPLATPAVRLAVGGGPIEDLMAFTAGVAAACDTTTATIMIGPTEGPIRLLLGMDGMASRVEPVKEAVEGAVVRPARLLNRREEVLLKVE